MAEKPAALALQAPGLAEQSSAEPVIARAQRSYREILQSSALIGGSAAINVGVGLVRTKAMAALLGPAGFGLMGAFMLLSELARNVAQMGLSSSGVRQIADAVGTGDQLRLAHTVTVLRRMSWACAAAGALVLLVFAAPLSSLTFGDNSQTGPIALLSLAVFLSVIAGAQGALLQGMRRIADLATLSVVSGVLSTVIAVPMVYFLGQRGLVPTLVAVAACSVLSTWWFSRKIKLLSTRMRASEVLRESSGLLSLGLAFMVSGLLMTGACYAVRVILLQRVGLEAAGVYQAAWTVGGLYVAYVLQAMSSDFYPRLVAKIDSPHDCNQLVNEQAHVSFLLGGPGILATLVFAPYLVAALYSVKFVGAVEVLRWIGLGMALRIVSYPMGYIIVAKNRRRLFVGTDLAWACFNIGMTYWCVIRFGVVGAGAAYALSYVLHCLMIYPIARRLTGFSWTRENQGAMLIFVGLITGVFAAPYLLPEPYASGLGVVAFLFSSLYSLSKLATLPGLPKLPNAISNTLQLVGSWRKGR